MRNKERVVLKPGDVLEGRYRVEELLGQGGMGAVYKATDLRLGRLCAVKETTLALADAGRMFEHEARSAGSAQAGRSMGYRRPRSAARGSCP